MFLTVPQRRETPTPPSPAPPTGTIIYSSVNIKINECINSTYVIVEISWTDVLVEVLEFQADEVAHVAQLCLFTFVIC